MVKNLRVTVDGDTHAVDSVEEAANLSDEAGGEDDVVAIHVQHTGREWVATVEDPGLDYEARDDRKWGAIRELVDLVDDRAQRFGF
ncbi:hypothetical protein SAMN04487946_105225 [Halobellus clavatus]|uniref:Uncharacterized protein n=1 Tax=Halobellus clavatus TaxID=660517 RepID=A0A1H3GN71_9EURY|nr:hypothetical protein SAMN04487946_105225 [Halobellus clavatus]